MRLILFAINDKIREKAKHNNATRYGHTGACMRDTWRRVGIKFKSFNTFWGLIKRFRTFEIKFKKDMK